MTEFTLINLRLITEFEHCENYFKVQGTQQSPE